MKNTFYAILTLSILLAWMASPLAAQNNRTEGTRIVITKEIRQADGSIVTETIVKEGAAAENFDLDDYLEDSGEEGVSLNIDINNNKDVTIERKPNCTSKSAYQFQNSCIQKLKSCTEKAFLGVSPMGDSENRDGVVVSIVRNSAAEAAGLERGDRILSINGQRTNSFSELSSIIKKTKKGDTIDLTYERNSLVYKIPVEMGNRNYGINFENEDGFDFDIDVDVDVDVDVDQVKGWVRNFPNGVRQSEHKEACLGVFSTKSILNGTKGSRITGFTDASAAETSGLRNGDLITAVNGESVDGHDELWSALAQYKADEVVDISYVRDGATNTMKIKLNPCDGGYRTNTVWEDEAPPQERRRTEKEVIVITKAKNEAAERTDAAPAPIAPSRTLEVRAYRAFPNPTDGVVNVEFEALAAPITISLLDAAGKQLFSEEINSFDGYYNRQFDLSAYSGRIMVAVQQGDKMFTEQLIVNR